MKNNVDNVPLFQPGPEVPWHDHDGELARQSVSEAHRTQAEEESVKTSAQPSCPRESN